MRREKRRQVNEISRKRRIGARSVQAYGNDCGGSEVRTQAEGGRECMNKPKESIAERIAVMTNEAKTMGDLHKMLQEIAYTLGGMVCHFDRDERSSLIIELTQAMGMGLQLTAKAIGEPSEIEVIVGHKP